MSGLSGDFENDNLSEDVDITSSSRSTNSSDSNDRTMALAEQAARTSDYLSDVSDILIPRRLIAPTGHAREGAQRLRRILQMGLTTHPACSFMDKLNGA